MGKVGKEVRRATKRVTKEIKRTPGNVMGALGMAPPKMPEMPEMPDYAAIEAASAEELRKREAAKRGRASTILAGGNNSTLGTSNIGASTLGGR